jgi:hypothetical protein
LSRTKTILLQCSAEVEFAGCLVGAGLEDFRRVAVLCCGASEVLGMRLFVSALLLTASSVAMAQNQPSPGAAGMDGMANWPGVVVFEQLPSAQTGCPVVLTSAHLNWPASYLPVTAAEKTKEPNLALEFGIASTQPVRSVGVVAHLMVKENIYQLEAGSYDLRLTFSGGDQDKATDQQREFRLPANLHAYGVTRVTVERITFSNGETWTAGATSHCSLNVNGSILAAR